MIAKKEIDRILSGYDRKDLKVAALCSHSALQLFYGARLEGLKTVGICKKKNRARYDAFPLAKPGEYVFVDRYEDAGEVAEKLAEENAIFIPHGSAVEYIGEKIGSMRLPFFGNRRVLLWEADRRKMLEWLGEAGCSMPESYAPGRIRKPSIVKFPGARGGRGYFVVSSQEEFEAKSGAMLKAGAITESDVRNAVIQEYLTGVRVYPHYFYTPFAKDGFKCAEGRLEMLGLDKRMESNVDEIYRPMSVGLKVEPSYTVVGNSPVIMRESLLDDVLEVGKRVVESSFRLFGGIYGPFCVEMIIDENFRLKVFEVSARIVAGTNIYPRGSQYSCYIFGDEGGMGTGRRIAREIKVAAQKNALQKIVY
ncbi:MAG: formate--phosphoribosylaminoimidazolecarboxamide ligase [Candidatus ainarchaeum sp.]|nr:formate--phosphoribosylaminoimidazolecarboxamide ligase [Candidatus ainarchaeum sp.]